MSGTSTQNDSLKNKMNMLKLDELNQSAATEQPMMVSIGKRRFKELDNEWDFKLDQTS
jgi:hypothetical protein